MECHLKTNSCARSNVTGKQILLYSCNSVSSQVSLKNNNNNIYIYKEGGGKETSCLVLYGCDSVTMMMVSK